MQICCAQLTQVYDNPYHAFARLEEFILTCDAEMIFFCEQYAAGWRALPSKIYENVKEKWLSLAKKYHKCLVGSYQRESPDFNLPFNTMLVCGPSGEVLAEYDKMHLFARGGEDKGYSSGNAPVTFSFEGITFGCSICFDLRFPELFREYLRKGVEVMLVQSAWPAARIADFELLLRARALENRCYAVGCNALGFDEKTGTDFAGRSMAADFEGRIIADAGVFEGGCTFEPDTDAVKEWRKEWGMIL